MLILCRAVEEGIELNCNGTTITLVLTKLRRSNAFIGIDAPPAVTIRRVSAEERAEKMKKSQQRFVGTRSPSTAELRRQLAAAERHDQAE